MDIRISCPFLFQIGSIKSIILRCQTTTKLSFLFQIGSIKSDFQHNRSESKI